MKKNYKKINQIKFRIERVTKKSRDNIYVKWKGNDNSFNRCVDKKDIIHY